MKFFKPLLVLLTVTTASLSDAGVITFDDHPLATQNGVRGIGNYAGFDFSPTLEVIDTVGSPSWNYGSVSGDFTMLNNYGGVGVVRDENLADFTFDGLWARTWSNYNTPRTGYIRGFNNGTEIWTSIINLTTSWAQYGPVSGLAIDELRLDLGNYFLVDDLALNEGTFSPVPDRGLTALLLGSCLLGLGFVRRRLG